ncbi:MAG: hypothetical protein HFJ17_00795 [Clostridia bacterium]|nr:hypothetical protein [Clostridia bacterium]
MEIRAGFELKSEENSVEFLRQLSEKINDSDKNYIEIEGTEVKIVADVTGTLGDFIKIISSNSKKMHNFVFVGDAKEAGKKPDKKKVESKKSGGTKKGKAAANAPKKKGKEEEKLQVMSFVKVIAESSTSYDDCIKRVAEEAGFAYKGKFFANVIKVANELDRITWGNIEGGFAKIGILYNDNDKVYCTRKLAETTNHNVSLLPLVKEVSQYKDYQFAEDTPQEKKTVKITCMPEIPEFEEFISNIDKTKPIEERAEEVLNYMGIDSLGEQERTEVIIFVKGMSNGQAKEGQDTMFPRMNLADVLRKFVAKHGSDKPVKVDDFIKELYKVLL